MKRALFGALAFLKSLLSAKFYSAFTPRQPIWGRKPYPVTVRRLHVTVCDSPWLSTLHAYRPPGYVVRCT
eukprot:2158570-Rhodomonas_salina.3